MPSSMEEKEVCIFDRPYTTPDSNIAMGFASPRSTSKAPTTPSTNQPIFDRVWATLLRSKPTIKAEVEEGRAIHSSAPRQTQ